jgi:hypothetical protein
MKELHTAIDIQATAQQVWKTLTDFEAFPEWNPFIRRAEGEIEVGAQLEVHLQPPGGSGMTFRPKLLKVEPNQELRWLGHLWIPGLFDGEHIFHIEPINEGQVRFVQRELFNGILVPFLAGSLDKGTRLGFEEMNRALKERVEGSAV